MADGIGLLDLGEYLGRVDATFVFDGAVDVRIQLPHIVGCIVREVLKVDGFSSSFRLAMFLLGLVERREPLEEVGGYGNRGDAGELGRQRPCCEAAGPRIQGFCVGAIVVRLSLLGGGRCGLPTKHCLRWFCLCRNRVASKQNSRSRSAGGIVYSRGAVWWDRGTVKRELMVRTTREGND